MRRTAGQLLALLSSVAVTQAGVAACGEADGLPVTEVAPGVYVHHGVHEDANASNGNDIANIGPRVRRAIDEGRTIEYAIGHVGYDHAARWALFEAYHRRNVTAAFAELEWE